MRIIVLLISLLFAVNSFAETTVVVGDLYNINDKRITFNPNYSVRIGVQDSSNTAPLSAQAITVDGFKGKPVNFTVTPTTGGSLPEGDYQIYVMYRKEGLLSYWYDRQTCTVTSPNNACLVSWQPVDEAIDSYVVAFNYVNTGQACSSGYISPDQTSVTITSLDCVLYDYVPYYTGQPMSFKQDLTITNSFNQMFIVNDGCDSTGMTSSTTPPIGQLCWNYYNSVFIGDDVSVGAINGIESVYIGRGSNEYGGGHYNVAVGISSFNVSGQENHYNVAIGHRALSRWPLYSASNSIAIGYNANFDSDVNHKLNIGNTLLGITEDNPPPDITDYLSNTFTPYGSFGHKVDIVTGSITLDETYNVVLCNAQYGAITITLPLANTAKGREYKIKKIDSSPNACTISTQGTDKIDGSSFIQLTLQYQSATIISDGISNWYKF